MQATSDIFLGWLHVDSGLDEKPRDFYGRQLKDWKGSAEIELMVPKGMATCTARCVAGRSRVRTPAAAIGSHSRRPRHRRRLRPRDPRVRKAYVEQNERDYQQLAAAVKSGRITAETGL